MVNILRVSHPFLRVQRVSGRAGQHAGPPPVPGRRQCGPQPHRTHPGRQLSIGCHLTAQLPAFLAVLAQWKIIFLPGRHTSICWPPHRHLLAAIGAAYCVQLLFNQM
jgi:hypothetical protein